MIEAKFVRGGSKIGHVEDLLCAPQLSATATGTAATRRETKATARNTSAWHCYLYVLYTHFSIIIVTSQNQKATITGLRRLRGRQVMAPIPNAGCMYRRRAGRISSPTRTTAGRGSLGICWRPAA